jgi:hypothetical protein
LLADIEPVKIQRIKPSANIYLSSRSARRDELLAAAEDCKAAGAHVVSSWLWSPECDLRDPEAAASAAARDLDDLRRADILVAFTEYRGTNEPGHGGRHVELGLALALPLSRIVLIGSEPEHIFHCLPEFDYFPEWGAARKGLFGSGS